MSRTIVGGSLVAILLGVVACGCAGMGKGPSDAELISSVLAGWKVALEAKDLEKLMVAYSEDFSGEGGAGKAQMRDFIKRAIDSGYLDGAKVDLEKAVTKIEGDAATVDPAGLSGDMGSVDLTLRLKKEADGAWRIIGSDRR